MLTRAIICVNACHPAQKRAHFLKSMRIELMQTAISTLRCWNPELAQDIYAVKFVYALIREMHLTVANKAVCTY